MTTELTDQMAQSVHQTDSLPDETPQPASEIEAIPCAVCAAPAEYICYRCKTDLCAAHTYREEEGTLDYCRACADALVGVCDVCDALHAKPCRECGMKVCQEHRKQVIERWGWGGLPGQGGVTSWFPMIRTYCQDHGQNRFDVAKPTLKSMTGYDGSSPEW